MMPSISHCFRLVVGFVIILANLYACQVSAIGPFLRNAENNYTRNTTMLFVDRQEQPQRQWTWENPNPNSVSQWKNTAGAGTGTVAGRFGNPSAPSQFSGVPAFGSAHASLQPQQAPRQKQFQTQLPKINQEVANDIASSVLRFAINVGSDLNRNAYYTKSEVFSPLSIMSALALLYAGSKGRSYQQLSHIFGLGVDSELHRNPAFSSLLHQEFGNLLQDIEQQDLNALQHHNVDNWRHGSIPYNFRSAPKNQKPFEHTVKVSNGFFTQEAYNLNPNYRDVVRTIYRSELDKLDFQRNGELARRHINMWVSNNTFGKIPTILSNAIPQDTKLILASALYFKGFWSAEFFDGATIPDNFYPEGENKSPIRVQMMANGGAFPYYDAVEYDARIIGLPYRGNLTTMYIIQPKHSSRAKLKEFQDRITPELIEELIGKLVYRSAIVALPKMHMVRQLKMKDVLLNLGISDIFSEQDSDLSLVGSLNNQNNNQNIAQNSNPNVIQSAPAFVNAQSRPWHAPLPNMRDRYNEAPLIFVTRFGEITTNDTKSNDQQEDHVAVKNSINVENMPSTKYPVTDTTEATTVDEETTTEVATERTREKRQTSSRLSALDKLEAERAITNTPKSDLYVDEILHKVDFEVNEHGTEAAAATVAVLRKSGPEILYRVETPFIMLIRHDPSKLILFYGIVNEPEY